MAKRITILQGHPDPIGQHFLHALVEAYAAGAGQAGHDVRVITIAELDVPLLRGAESFYHEDLPVSLHPARDSIGWADHVVIAYPLWLGQFPALLHAFLEQIIRPGFAIDVTAGGHGKKLLTGKSARLVVTMAMPGFVYRWLYGALSARSLERHILNFSGIAPVRRTFIGSLGSGTNDPLIARFLPMGLSEGARKAWLARLSELGRQAL